MKPSLRGVVRSRESLKFRWASTISLERLELDIAPKRAVFRVYVTSLNFGI